MAVEEGRKAPAFTLADENGEKVRLSELAGNWVVLYFYPRDDTPGCTVEACDFTSGLKSFEKIGAKVYGCSPDSGESHRKFIKKYKLKIGLLSDPSHKVMEKYGAWGEKVLYGKRSIGMTRATFIIGPDGKLVRVWKRAKAADNPAAVLKALREAAANR